MGKNVYGGKYLWQVGPKTGKDDPIGEPESSDTPAQNAFIVGCVEESCADEDDPRLLAARRLVAVIHDLFVRRFGAGEGRVLHLADNHRSAPAVLDLVNETFARRYLAGVVPTARRNARRSTSALRNPEASATCFPRPTTPAANRIVGRMQIQYW